LVAFALATPAWAAPLSRRVVAYQIEASLDVVSDQLQATEKITWTNPSSQSQSSLYLHLYWNAFRGPETTYLRESGGIDRGVRFVRPGWIRLRRIQVDNQDLLPGSRFIRPDDGNTEDDTLLEVRLPKAVAPGQTVIADIVFESQFPGIFARTGVEGDFYFAGQWFPKVAALVRDRWNLHQFHAASEFFADFGQYDVSLRLPARFVLGATGRVVSRSPEPNDLQRVVFHAEDVHDFAWTADPDFVVVRERLALGGFEPFDVTLLLRPGNARHKDRYLFAIRATMLRLSRWYGPYPYATLTVVDPPADAVGANAMEYPQLITAGLRWRPWDRSLSFESTLMHELAHQYWYGIVASNEFEEPYLDEGFASYSAGRILNEVYGGEHFDSQFGSLTLAKVWPVALPWSLGSWLGLLQEWPWATYASARILAPLGEVSRYRPIATVDPLVRFSWQYRDLESYAANAYARTELTLTTLERILGRDTFDRAMRAYFERWRFDHPRLTDFISILEESSGRRLDALVEPLFFRAIAPDFRIDSLDVSSEPGRWRSAIRLGRTEGATLAVDILLVFEDGSRQQRRWDNDGTTWTEISTQTVVPLRYAEIDPQRVFPIDADFSNNRRYAQASSRARLGWTARFLFWTQNVMHFWSGLA